jgi:hypothetical protein
MRWILFACGEGDGAMRTLIDTLPQLTDIVPGRYVFRLRVTDEQGETDEDTVSVIVKHGKWRKKLRKHKQYSAGA